jgi:nucleoside-diphosphate-sugar epimerase
MWDRRFHLGSGMVSSGKTIFLTGGAGVLGQALLEKLSGGEVICLEHQKAIVGSNVRTLQGDICRPYLGLSPSTFEDLARRIDYIVHSAALTNFSRPEKVYFDINAQGTRRVLELAARAAVPICHISTAFAYSGRHVSDHYRTHAYERSKLEAERIVRDSGLSSVIVRPSIVIGDSRDGSMSSFQGFHFLMDLFVGRTLPVPAASNALVDFVPRDLVAAVVMALTKRPDVTGEYWITAGEQAVPLERVVTLWVERLRCLTGRVVKQPRFVDADIIERLFRPAFLPALPPVTQMLIGRALELVKYFNITRPFPSSLGHLTAILGTPPLPNLELTLIRNVEFRVHHFTSSQKSVPGSYRTGNQQYESV